jgi:UDP-N-acetyl-D-mannosaminuronic acid dehydrogenase
VKLMENAYRDVNIALANEFAAVARTLEIDPGEAIALANRHPRVDILRPGIGVGGHCIPIDPWFIKEVEPANSRLIFTARLINDEMPAKIAARIRATVRDIENAHIVAVGVAYKANTADTRGSPANEIVRLLRADGYRVDHFDPLVGGMAFPSTLAAACTDADCLALLVEHEVVMEEVATTRADIQKAMRTGNVLRF